MRKSAFVATVVLLAAGCSSEGENPFASLERTHPIPAWADILTTSNLHAPGEGAPREVFAVSSSDGRIEQLTFPRSDSNSKQDRAVVAPMPDADRILLLEQNTVPDEPYPIEPTGAVVFFDLARGVRSELIPWSTRVSGIDVSPDQPFFAFSALGAQDLDDLFWRELMTTGATSHELTKTPTISERHPRFDRSSQYVIYDRMEGESPSEIWYLASADLDRRVTQAGAEGRLLPQTPYRVGSDADPCISPDNAWIAFRRLTSVGTGRLGEWEILVVDSNGDNAPATIVSGPAYRSAPDWGQQGIVFSEWDPTSNRWSLVVVAPDGSGRRTLIDRDGPTRFDSPRWIS